MTHLYMARRRVYPAETAVFGPFSNHAAALACAQDSLYPELAEVDTIDLSRVSTLYVPQTSYPTGYCVKRRPITDFRSPSRISPRIFRRVSPLRSQISTRSQSSVLINHP